MPPLKAVDQLTEKRSALFKETCSSLVRIRGRDWVARLGELTRTEGINKADIWERTLKEKPVWEYLRVKYGITDDKIRVGLCEILGKAPDRTTIVKWRRRGIPEDILPKIKREAIRETQVDIPDVSISPQSMVEFGLIAEAGFVREQLQRRPPKCELTTERWWVIVTTLLSDDFFSLFALDLNGLATGASIRYEPHVTLNQVETSARLILNDVDKATSRAFVPDIANGIDLLALCSEWAGPAIVWIALRKFGR